MTSLEVSGQLTLEMGEHTVALQADHECITVELQHWRAGLQFWRQTVGCGASIGSLEGLREALLAADLTVCICLAGRTILRLGVHARPNISARLLKLGPVELRPLTLGWACLPRRSRRFKAD